MWNPMKDDFLDEVMDVRYFSGVAIPKLFVLGLQLVGLLF